MKRNAFTGAIVWCSLLIASLTGAIDLIWIELLFLYAPLVIVPLGLHLTGLAETGFVASLPERVAEKVHIFAALAVVASFFSVPGIIAAILACAWIVLCGLLALGGLMRTLQGGLLSLDTACPTVAFLYSLIGAAWFVASRLGLNPLGFQEPIVLLTAVHFHFAGFAASLLARSANRTLVRSSATPVAAALLRIVILGVLIGPALLAAGFVAGPRVKLAGALIVALSEVGLATLFVVALKHIARFAAQFLLTLSAASVAFSMALAAVWAIGEYPLQQFVNLDQMERYHGTANAFGFTLCGLLGWTLAARPSQTEVQTQ